MKKMIKDMARGALAELNINKPVFPRALVNINDLPVQTGDEMMRNPDVRMTSLVFHIKYSPKPFKAKDKPYVLVADIMQMRKVRFKNWEELVEYSQKDKDVAWIFRNAEISEEHLEIARKHIDLVIPVFVDVVKYVHKIKEKLPEELKNDKDYSIFRTKEQNEIEQNRYKFYLETKKKGASKLV